MTTGGKKKWMVADARFQSTRTGGEYLCFLNANEEDAAVRMAFLFGEKKAPIEDVIVVVKAQTTRHLALDRSSELGGISLPEKTAFGIVLKSDIPIVVQHSRLVSIGDQEVLLSSQPYSE
ncbi:MAG: sensory rhodopsin transducer [Verrucomicrobiota bacterium]